MDFLLSPNYNENSLATLRLEEEIISTNEEASQYGLALTANDARTLIRTAKTAIAEHERIEISGNITPMLIDKFIQSKYISQGDYADTIAALLDVFYEATDETLERLSDSEIIDTMFLYFENESKGSVELLRTREMESLYKAIRKEVCGVSEDDFEEDDDGDLEIENYTSEGYNE